MTSSSILRRLAAVALTALVATPAVAAAEEPAADVNLMVLRENATGSASAAQGYIDELVAAIAKTAGWGSARRM